LSGAAGFFKRKRSQPKRAWVTIAFVVWVRFGGVRFVAYSNDHPPRHVRGFSGETEAIVELGANRTIALAKRGDAVRPANAKRSDVKKILRAAAEHFEELAALWENIHGKSDDRG
jgi:Domain of unknown function (DUF4160)